MQAGQAPKIINLSGPQCVERAATLKKELAAALPSGDVVLNFASIDELDLACLQVIYSARASAKAKGKQLHLKGPLPSRLASRLLSCGFVRGDVGRFEDLETSLVGF